MVSPKSSLSVMLLAGLTASLLLAASEAAANGNGADTCAKHVEYSCDYEVGSEWTDSSGMCNAIYGNFEGNTDNLHQLMRHHFRESFRFLLMGSIFDTDEVNRMGIHGYLSGYSDKMWDNGLALMKYIVKRGGSVGNSFKVEDAQVTEEFGELDALGTALDMMKATAEKTVRFYKHSMNKHVISPTAEPGFEPSYDPGIAHLLEEDFIEPYTDDIRELAGHVNLLAKIVKNDNTKGLGLHLYDQHLKQ